MKVSLVFVGRGGGQQTRFSPAVLLGLQGLYQKYSPKTQEKSFSADTSRIMSRSMRDRRRFTRVGLSLAAIIRGKGEIAAGRIEDISLNGLYMHLHNRIALELEEPVVVDMYLNDWFDSYSVLTVHGRAAHVDQGGVGVQFRPMTVADQGTLRVIISLMLRGEDAHEEGQPHASLPS